MNLKSTPPDDQTDGRAAAVKAFVDLNVVVDAMLTTLRTGKPWQRQLRAHLEMAAHRLQILRMTIAMDRCADEIRDAALCVVQALKVADAYVTTVRCDQDTRLGIRVAFRLVQQANKTLASHSI